MKSTDASDKEGPLSKMEEAKIARVTRQSNKRRNPRRLRRAITSTGKPGAVEWTVHEQALLGKMSDADLARRLGRTFVAIRVRRNRLGIPNYRHPVRRWTPEEEALLVLTCID